MALEPGHNYTTDIQKYAPRLVFDTAEALVPDQRGPLQACPRELFKGASAAVARAWACAGLAVLNGAHDIGRGFRVVLDAMDEEGRNQHRDTTQCKNNGDAVVSRRPAWLLEDAEENTADDGGNNLGCCDGHVVNAQNNTSLVCVVVVAVEIAETVLVG